MNLRLHARHDGLGPSLIRQVFDAAPPSAINLGLGQPDLAVPGVAVEAARAEVERGVAPYPTNAGRVSLRQAIVAASRAHRDGGAIVGDWFDTDGVVVTVGAQEALFVALSALVGSGDEIVVPNPGFPGYPMIARCLGAHAVSYELDPVSGFDDLAGRIRSVLSERTRAVVIGSPANPTGAVATPDQLREVAVLLNRRGVPWVSDEIYDRYCYDQPFASISAFSEQGIVVGGVSKSGNMMGWRCGWALGPRHIGRTLTAIHQTVCSCVATPSQAAAEAICLALAGGPGADEIADNLQQFAERRRLTLDILGGLSHGPAQGAFYFFCDVRRQLGEGSDVDLARRLAMDAGVITIPGTAFGAGGTGWLRIAYTSDRLQEGLTVLRDFLTS